MYSLHSTCTDQRANKNSLTFQLKKTTAASQSWALFVEDIATDGGASGGSSTERMRATGAIDTVEPPTLHPRSWQINAACIAARQTGHDRSQNRLLPGRD